jgi:hypothetical protein
MRNRLMVLVAGLAVAGLLGMGGCKNVCEKAADHMKSCMEEYCAAHSDAPMCGHQDEESSSEVGECNDAAKEMAETLLNKSCDEIFGGTTTTEGGGGN